MGTFSVHTNNLLLDGSLISYQIRNWIEVSNGCTVRTIELVPNMSLIFLRVADITTHPERNSLYKRSIKKPDHPFIATNKPGSNSVPYLLIFNVSNMDGGL